MHSASGAGCSRGDHGAGLGRFVDVCTTHPAHLALMLTFDLMKGDVQYLIKLWIGPAEVPPFFGIREKAMLGHGVF